MSATARRVLLPMAVLGYIPFARGFDAYAAPKELALMLCGALALLGLLSRPWERWSAPAALWLGSAAWASLGLAWATDGWLAMRSVGILLGSALLFTFLQSQAAEEVALWRRALLACLGVAAAVALAEAVWGFPLSMGGRAPGGLSGNRNFLSHLLVLGLPLAAFGVMGRGRSAWASGGLVVLWVAVIVLGRSRGAWIGAGIVLAVSLSALAWRREPWPRLLLLVALGGLVANTLPTALRWSETQPFAATAGRLLDVKEGTGRGRVVQYSATVDLIRDRPLLGTGPGNWSVHYPEVASPGDPNLRRGTVHPVNRLPNADWLAVAAERGVPGLLLWIGLWGALVRGALHRLREEGAPALAALLALGAMGLVDAVWIRPEPAVALAVIGATVRPTRWWALPRAPRLWTPVLAGAALGLCLASSARQNAAMWLDDVAMARRVYPGDVFRAVDVASRSPCDVAAGIYAELRAIRPHAAMRPRCRRVEARGVRARTEVFLRTLERSSLADPRGSVTSQGVLLPVTRTGRRVIVDAGAGKEYVYSGDATSPVRVGSHVLALVDQGDERYVIEAHDGAEVPRVAGVETLVAAGPDALAIRRHGRRQEAVLLGPREDRLVEKGRVRLPGRYRGHAELGNALLIATDGGLLQWSPAREPSLLVEGEISHPAAGSGRAYFVDWAGEYRQVFSGVIERGSLIDVRVETDSPTDKSWPSVHDGALYYIENAQNHRRLMRAGETVVGEGVVYRYGWREGRLQVIHADLSTPVGAAYVGEDGLERLSRAPRFLSLGEARRVCDGSLGSAWVFEPRGAPVGVMLHVRGGTRDDVSPRYDPWIQLWLEQGYVVIAPNFPGSVGEGRAWLERGSASRVQAVLEGWVAQVTETYGRPVLGIGISAGAARVGRVRGLAARVMVNPTSTGVLPVDATPTLVLAGGRDPYLEGVDFEGALKARSGGKGLSYAVYPDEGHVFRHVLPHAMRHAAEFAANYSELRRGVPSTSPRHASMAKADDSVGTCPPLGASRPGS